MDAKSYCLLHTSPHSSVASPAQVTSHRGCALTAHCGAQCAADTRLHQLREHPGTPLQRISRADDERSWQCLRPFGGSVWSRLEQRLAAHRSASASDSLPSDAPTSAGNATCATVVAPSTTSTGRAATSLRRTCPSCAWPLQRGPHHPADPLLVPGGLLCRVKWTRGVRRRRGPAGLRRRGTDPGTCTKANPPTMRPQSPCCPCAIPGVAQHRCPDPGRRGRAGGRVLVHPGGMV